MENSSWLLLCLLLLGCSKDGNPQAIRSGGGDSSSREFVRQTANPDSVAGAVISILNSEGGIMVPSIRVIGAHPVPLTNELFGAAMELKYGGQDLTRGEYEEAEKAVRDELSSIALLEVEVNGVDRRFSVDHFGQGDSEQAPYDAAFLSKDGEKVVERSFSQPHGPNLRIAFFLHFFDWTRPLRTSYGEVPVPGSTPIPRRLAALMPYEPVD